jgi:uncharacterized protein DUF397
MATSHLDLPDVTWRKSSYSSSSGQNCVEIATQVSGDVAVRDSQSPSGAVLLISRADWRAFVRGLRED